MNPFKVAILGGAGGVGQPLALLLKQDKLVSEISLYDEAKCTPGVALDLSHINTCSNVEGVNEKKALFETLTGATVVVLAAGKSRYMGNMPRQDLFHTNADVLFQLMLAVVAYSPDALICVVTNPVNALVPMVSEFMMKACILDPRRVFGVTTLDQIRAAKFVAQMNNTAPSCQYVPVVGGNDGSSIVPLLSQSNPPFMHHNQTVVNCMIMQIREAGRKVIQKKAGAGSSTLTSAFAVARFVNSLLRGLTGESCIEFAYVRSDVTESPYFSNPVVLGRTGMEGNLGLGTITPFERQMVNRAVPVLKKNIKESLKYIKRHEKLIPTQI